MVTQIVLNTNSEPFEFASYFKMRNLSKLYMFIVLYIIQYCCKNAPPPLFETEIMATENSKNETKKVISVLKLDATQRA